jgi:hypothetical protein
MLTIKLQGGLGNQLFQLGFLDYISKITGKEKYICELHSPSTVHSQNQYYETIFQEWTSLYKNIPATIIHEHPHMIKQEWTTHSGNICYMGYFQRYEYMDLIKDEFIGKLKFNTSILEKYPEISNKIFIHIRGGDYLTIPYHNVCNKEYYDKAINHFNSEFVIFTNDIPYAKTILPNTQIIEENELDTLYLMSKAKGGICANSSFSWWGAYLNSNRKIIIPSKWVNDETFHHETYRVPGWIVI